VTPRLKWSLLLALYLSQGLPFGFFTQALPVLLREEGASLARIGVSGLLFLPWALKWLVAPAVDASGSRRSWIIPLQLAAVAVALGLSTTGESGSARLLCLQLGIVLTALIAAMQDVPTDGWAVRLLAAHERGLGNAVQVGGYRLGMVLGSGVLMIVLDRVGWAAAFIGMATLLLVALLPVLFATEAPLPAASVAPTSPPRLFRRLRERLAVRGVWTLLLALAAYKFGDAMASAMAKPFLVDLGWSKSQIGAWAGIGGSFGALVGALLGGLVADRLGRPRTLLLTGIAQTLAVLLYAAAALRNDLHWLTPAAIVAEHLLGSMATVALFTLMMDASDPAHSATDYTLQASVVVIATGFAGMVGGVLGDATGFAGLFAVAALLSAAGCAWLLQRLHAHKLPARLHATLPAIVATD
jgi:predicted MFS family arabinose efflux permease